jgi:hypothetical protein
MNRLLSGDNLKGSPTGMTSPEKAVIAAGNGPTFGRLCNVKREALTCGRLSLVVLLISLLLPNLRIDAQAFTNRQPLAQRTVSDAVASAQIAASKEIEAENILREAEVFKKAGNFQEGAEKLREILPLCSQLNIAPIVKASQALDSILLKWELDSQRQVEAEQAKQARQVSQAGDGDTAAREKYAAKSTELAETTRSIVLLERDLRATESALSEHEMAQSQTKTVGGYATRTLLQKKCVQLKINIDAMKLKASQLQDEVALTRPRANSIPSVQPRPIRVSQSAPWKLYDRLREDFREAIREAKGRNSKQR